MTNQNETPNRSRKFFRFLLVALLGFLTARFGADLHLVTALVPSRETLVNIAWGIVVIPVGIGVFALVVLG